MPGAAPPPPTLLEVCTEVFYYLGLSVAVGMGIAIAILTLPEISGGTVASSIRRLARPAAVFIAFTAALNFLAATAKYAKTGIWSSLNGRAVSAFVASPPTHANAIGGGAIAVIQLGGYVLVIVALVALSRLATRLVGSAVAAFAVLAAIIPEIPYTTPTFASTLRAALTTMHVLAALFWIGGLVVLAVAGLAQRRRSISLNHKAESVADEWYRIWERFSIVALYAVGAIVVSGTWLAWSHVGTPAQFLTTTYGRYLTVKLLIVVLLLAAGAYNARVLLPMIRAARRRRDTRAALHIAARHFPLVVAVESLLAVAVLVIVPFLRGSARAEAGWPAAGSFDLGVFGVGAVLVALVAAALWFGTRVPPRSAGLFTPSDRRSPTARASADTAHRC